MHLDLRLADLPTLRLGSSHFAGTTSKLKAIAKRNHSKAISGAESRELKNRKEQMKRRLIRWDGVGSFEQATREVGRERLLLSLYLEYATRSEATWLPEFDQTIARSVLGATARGWHAGRRRQATQLFFTHFDQLPQQGLSHLCDLLNEAYTNEEQATLGVIRSWCRYREILFNVLGDHGVAKSAKTDESLPDLMNRFGVPGEGRFAERLRQVFLLNALRVGPIGQEIPALGEIEKLRTKRASVSQLMGAAALQIMVQRIATEGKRKWTGEWSNWITRLGCDPRHGRSSADGAQWWGWATDDELRLAQQGITGLTLRFFIEFLRRSLQGTDKEPQFALRSRFLLRLYESGKIESARLALNWSAYQHLERKYRDNWTVAHLSATTDETSMICLKCVDDIFVIEGTHSFGLRMFHRQFPIRGFWERPKQTYQDRELRISPADCPVFLRHDQGGRWVNGFFHQLRTQFHIEWSDVRI